MARQYASACRDEQLALTYIDLLAVTINGTTYSINGETDENIFRHTNSTEEGVPEQHSLTNDMACGPGATQFTAPKFATVEAGSSIQMNWTAGWGWEPSEYVRILGAYTFPELIRPKAISS